MRQVQFISFRNLRVFIAHLPDDAAAKALASIAVAEEPGVASQDAQPDGSFAAGSPPRAAALLAD